MEKGFRHLRNGVEEFVQVNSKKWLFSKWTGIAIALMAALAMMMVKSSQLVLADIMPGENVINSGVASVPKAGELADGKYSVIAQYTDRTKMDLMGADKSAWTKNTGSINPGSIGFDTTDAYKGKAGMIYTNVASQNGRELDLAIVATDWTPSVKGIRFGRGFIGVYLTTQQGNQDAVDAQFKFVYLDHETKAPVTVNGFYTFDDIDWGQAIGFNSDTWSHVDKAYVPTAESRLHYHKSANGSFIFEPDENAGGEDDPKQEVTLLYSGASAMDMLFSSRYSPEPYLGKLSTTATANYQATIPYEDITKTGVTDKFDSYFGYVARKPLRTDTAIPAKTVSDSNEKNVAANTLNNRNEKYSYSVTQFIPQEHPEFFYKKAQFSDSLNSVLNLESYKVVDENGTDRTAWFPKSGDGNNLTFAAAPATLNNADFYGHTYTLTMNTVIKGDADLTPLLKGNFWEIPNTATFSTDTGTKPTDTVKTKIPATGKLQIIKVDAASPDKKLVNATYSVTNGKGEVVATLTTDENGTATTGDLLVGTYSVKETKAPEGYKLDPKTYTATVDGTQPIVKVSGAGNQGTVSDTRRQDIPETGSMALAIGIIVIVFGTGGSAYAFNKRKKL